LNVTAYDESSTPPLPTMSEAEQLVADLWATGITRDAYPTALIRSRLDSLGIVPASALRSIENRTPGHGRRRGDPSATSGDRTWRHVPQPGGRDRNGERYL
jgi:hypothetical protein